MGIRPAMAWHGALLAGVLAWLGWSTLPTRPTLTPRAPAATPAPRVTAITPARVRTVTRGELARVADLPPGAHPDLFAFVQSARSQGLPRGHYLAMKAYDFCTREARLTLDQLPPPDVPVADGRQLAAQSALATMCAGFQGAGRHGIDYYQLAEEGLATGDATLAAARALERLSAHWDAGNREPPAARQALIGAVLRSGDPWLLRDLAAELEVLQLAGTVEIGGERVPPGEAADLADAVRLMACQAAGGEDCAREGAWQRLLACASAGECDAPASPASAGALRWLARLQGALAAGAAIDVLPTERVY